MPELLEVIVEDDAVPSTSQRLSLKEKIINSVTRKTRRPRIPVETDVGGKRRTDSRSVPTIEETLYSSGSEKRALIFGQPPDPSEPGEGKLAHTANLFASTDTLASGKQCRICHSGADHHRNPLIAPCRCSGTMQHVHTACLIHWLEVSSEKFWPTTRCELCGFKFQRHPIWRLRGFHWPASSYQDRVLNCLFVFLLFLMLICGVIASNYSHSAEAARFRATRVVRIGNAYFSGDEITVVVAGILFFMSFVLALCTQYRAGGTIFRQAVRFWTINRNWQIRDYDALRDETPTSAAASARPLMP